MNTASRMLVTKQDNTNGGRGLPELFSSCPVSKASSSSSRLQSRDAAFTSRRFLWLSPFSTLFADRAPLDPAYARHVSELCILWIFNEPLAIFFPGSLPRNGKRNSRALGPDVVWGADLRETEGILGVGRFRMKRPFCGVRFVLFVVKCRDVFLFNRVICVLLSVLRI